MVDSRCSKNYFLEFEKDFPNTLNKHAPMKAKTVLQRNHKPKTINTSQGYNEKIASEKKAKKNRDPKDFIKYKKKRNSVVKLNRHYKKEHFDHLNPFHDPKPFWKTCEPYFSNILLVNQKLL